MFERLFSDTRVRPSAHLCTWLPGLCFLARAKSATCICPWFTGTSAPARCTWLALGSRVHLRSSLWSGVFSGVQGVPQALLFFSGPDGGAGSLGILGQTVVLLLSLGLVSESRTHHMDPVAYSEVFQKPTEGDAGRGGSDMTVSFVSILGRTMWCPLLRGRGLMDLVSQQVAGWSLWVMVPGSGLVSVTSKQAPQAQQEPTGVLTCT